MRKEEKQIQRRREEGHVKMGRTAMTCPQAKNTWGCQQPPEARREHGVGPPSECPEGTNPADTSVSVVWPPELGEYKFFVILSHQIYFLIEP